MLAEKKTKPSRCKPFWQLTSVTSLQNHSPQWAIFLIQLSVFTPGHLSSQQQIYSIPVLFHSSNKLLLLKAEQTSLLCYANGWKKKSAKLQMWEDDKPRFHAIWLMTRAAELSDLAYISTAGFLSAPQLILHIGFWELWYSNTLSELHSYTE